MNENRCEAAEDQRRNTKWTEMDLHLDLHLEHAQLPTQPMQNAVTGAAKTPSTCAPYVNDVAESNETSGEEFMLSNTVNLETPFAYSWSVSAPTQHGKSSWDSLSLSSIGSWDISQREIHNIPKKMSRNQSTREIVERSKKDMDTHPSNQLTEIGPPLKQLSRPLLNSRGQSPSYNTATLTTPFNEDVLNLAELFAEPTDSTLKRASLEQELDCDNMANRVEANRQAISDEIDESLPDVNSFPVSNQYHVNTRVDYDPIHATVLDQMYKELQLQSDLDENLKSLFATQKDVRKRHATSVSVGGASVVAAFGGSWATQDTITITELPQSSQEAIKFFLFDDLHIPPSVSLDGIYINFTKCSRKRKKLGRESWNKMEEEYLRSLSVCCHHVAKLDDSVAVMQLVSGVEAMLEALRLIIR